MEKEEQRFPSKCFWMKNWNSTKLHQELVTTLGSDAYGRFQIKIWFRQFGNGDPSWKDAPRTGHPPLTLGSQLAVFLQKYLFASARVLARQFLTGVPTIEEILQRQLGVKKFSGRWVPRFLSLSHKVADVEASTEMPRILHESEKNHLKESQQVTSPSSNMPIPLRNVCMVADRRHSKDAPGHLEEANYDNIFLCQTQTNRAQHLTKRTPI
jgi:hypothetical protein